MKDFFMAFVMVLTLTLLWTCVASVWKNKELKVEAVKRGFAEWAVSENGSTTWQWKEGGK